MTGLFEKTETTGAEEPIAPELLPLLRIIQCDGYVVYPSWAKDKAWIKLMGCHSHVRRKFFEATEQSPRLVAWILRQLAHLYHVEKRLRETQAGPTLREAARAAEIRMSYAINQLPNLETFLGEGRVEICINLVENAIRPTKLGAKNWLFIGNGESGQKCAILNTIVENCHRLGIPSQGIPYRCPPPPARNASERRQLAHSPKQQAGSQGGLAA